MNWQFRLSRSGLAYAMVGVGFMRTNSRGQGLAPVAWKTALLYAATAALWIWLSGSLLHLLVSDPILVGRIELYKGWVFVAVTSLLLYVTLRSYLSRAEAAVQERLKLEKQLSRLAATAPGVIYTFRLKPDGSTWFPYVSPSVEALFGFESSEIMSDANRILALIHPEDAPRVDLSMRESAASLESWRQEFRVRHPRKGEIWLEGRCVPEREPDGSILWHGFFYEITQRKRADEAHARLAAAVEQAAEAIVITNPEGTILYVNPAFEKVTGYSANEVLGQNPRILKSGKHDAAFYTELWGTLCRGEVWTGRMTNKRKDGSLYQEEITISPVHDSTGRIVNYVAVKRDVTQEEALEAQLRQSQKMDAIGQLAGGVAHDFNNILTVIRGHATLLANGNLAPAENADCSQQIIRAADRATDLVRQLLLFSRKQAMQPADLNLNEVVAGMTRMLKRLLGEDVALSSDLASGLPRIVADAGMLEQVLLNLSVNARDAMPDGGKLTIATGTERLDPRQAAQIHEAKPGLHVWLEVHDTGSGIAPAVLPHIFEPFFTTKEVGKGTGLGLATVYGIVQQHHGWITVSTAPGQGTRFRIYLPAAPSRDNTGAAPSAPIVLPRGSETLLVVEDETSLRALMCNVLTRCGYTVLQAESGSAALKLWEREGARVELLLTDLVMPEGINGVDLGRALLARNPGLKIIYTSGYTAQTGDGLRLIEGENFLQKPFPNHKLAQTVRRRLDSE